MTKRMCLCPHPLWFCQACAGSLPDDSKARADERKAIVKWLRRESPPPIADLQCELQFVDVADAIEQGEHLR